MKHKNIKHNYLSPAQWLLYVLPAVTLTVVCPHNVFIAFARFSEHGA
jgi:hypothetical protein